jgi:hypothetical protein
VALLFRCCGIVVPWLWRCCSVVVALLFRGSGVVVPLFRRCWCCDVVDVSIWSVIFASRILAVSFIESFQGLDHDWIMIETRTMTQKDSERILDESCLRHVSLEIFDPPWNNLLPKKTHSTVGIERVTERDTAVARLEVFFEPYAYLTHVQSRRRCGTSKCTSVSVLSARTFLRRLRSFRFELNLFHT